MQGFGESSTEISAVLGGGGVRKEQDATFSWIDHRLGPQTSLNEIKRTEIL